MNNSLAVSGITITIRDSLMYVNTETQECISESDVQDEDIESGLIVVVDYEAEFWEEVRKSKEEHEYW